MSQNAGERAERDECDAEQNEGGHFISRVTFFHAELSPDSDARVSVSSLTSLLIEDKGCNSCENCMCSVQMQNKVATRLSKLVHMARNAKA